MLDVPSVFLLQGGVTLLVRLDPGGGDNAPKMRNKGLQGRFEYNHGQNLYEFECVTVRGRVLVWP